MSETAPHLIARPASAQADDRPCELYRDHGSSSPTITEGHHIYPVYLQNRVYGEIRRGDVIFVCGNCHESTHAWLYFLLGERRQPNVMPPARCRALAEKAYEWYRTESAEA